MIRMDRGTENTKVAALQYALREADSDDFAGIRSIQYGTSPANIVTTLIDVLYVQHFMPI